MVLIPTIKDPSGVRTSLPRNVVVGFGSVTEGSPVGVGGGGENDTAVNCCAPLAVGSNRYSDCIVVAVPVPSVVISARPSAPASTPSGFEGRLTVCMTCEEFRSMTLTLAL